MFSFVSRLRGSSAAGIFRSPFLSPSSSARRAPTMTAALNTASSSSNPADEPLTSPQPEISPWLMLPPKAGDNMVCKFYNLAEDRVESFKVELPDPDDAVLVGSSHGWLAFFNQRNNHVFLSNPLSGMLLKLPSIDNVKDTEMNLRGGFRTVSKLILSSPPERIYCRAMISSGPGVRPASCYTEHGSTHWTSLGDWLLENKKLCPDGFPKYTDARTYEDLVYCTRRKKFSLITEFQIDHDCGLPSSPTRLEEHGFQGGGHRMFAYALSALRSVAGESVYEKCFSWLSENKKLIESCTQIPYLVYNEQCNRLYIMTRFLHADPYRTIGFLVFKLEYGPPNFKLEDVEEHPSKQMLKDAMFDGEEHPSELMLADSLDGLAVFVGMNQSFAVSSPAEFGLKPNSIYFTDAANARVTPPAIHGHDNGIFDYVNKTLFPCPGPHYDDAQTLSTPVWFAPSPYLI